MSSVNLHTREVSVKVVYYGPGVGGKTSSLQFIHRALRPDTRGQLVSLATGSDRTLYFDFLPLRLPKVGGFSVRVQLYTVPGQVHYNSTRKLVLTGADGVVFVADSQQERRAANLESLADLEDNLREQGLAIRAVPLVFQYNKRDAPNAAPAAELDAELNRLEAPWFETVATRGTGVIEALKRITTLVLSDLRRKGSLGPSDAAAAGPGPSDGVPATVTGPEPSGARRITAGSLSDVADAIDNLEPPAGRSVSGTFRAVTSSPARAISDLLQPGPTRDAAAAVESDIDRGDWAGAVRRASAGFRELAGRLAGSLAADPGADAAALAALLTGVPAGRYLRFREVDGRVQAQGAVTSADALFALFFLTDVALRAEDLRR